MDGTTFKIASGALPNRGTEEVDKLEEGRAKLLKSLGCRPATIDYWLKLLGSDIESGLSENQLAAVGAIVEIKRRRMLGERGLARLFLEMCSQSDEQDWWVVRKQVKEAVPSLVFEPPIFDLASRKTIGKNFVFNKRRFLEELEASGSE